MAYAADFFLQLEDVKWTILAGVAGDTLIVSYRFDPKGTSTPASQNSFNGFSYGLLPGQVNMLLGLGVAERAADGTTLTETVRAAFTDEHVAAIVESTALKRMVEHDELARLSVFLTSDLARCITGQLILADAGAFLSRSRPRNLRHEETQLGEYAFT